MITKRLLLLFTLMLTLFSFRANAQCPNPTSVTFGPITTTPRKCGTDGEIAVTFNPAGPGSNITVQLLKNGAVVDAKVQPVSPLEFKNLEPGGYKVRLVCSEDNSQILKTESVTVGDDYVPITAANISASGVCSNFTPGGTIKIDNVTGGTTPYQYSIIKNDDAAYDDSLSEYSDSDSKEVNEFGTYQIRIKDACNNYRTFPYVLQPAVPEVSYHFRTTAICSDPTKAEGSFWYMWNSVTGSGSSFAIHPNGVKLEIRADNASGQLLKTVVLANGAATFEYTMSSSHKYHVTTINACGVKTSYQLDNTSREKRDFHVDAGTSGCGVDEKMYVLAPLKDYHFWRYPVEVTLKKSDGTVVETKTLPNRANYSKDGLTPGEYEVTVTDACGKSLTRTVDNPQDAGTPTVSIYELLKWRCEEIGGPLTQEGTTQVLIEISGYLPDRQNAVVKITSGPSNVGIAGEFVDERYWGWTNMLPGTYTVEYSSCGQTHTGSFNVVTNDLLKQSFTASATSLCGGTGTINSTYQYTGSHDVEFRLFKSGETNPTQTNSTGTFSNLPAGNYVLKMIVQACDIEYQVGSDANLTITAAGVGASVTSIVGSVCEDAEGNPLTTGRAYLTISGVAPFKVSYSIAGTNNWTTIENVQYNTVIPGLEANEEYALKITDNCGDLVNASVTVSTIGALSTSTTVNPCVNKPYTLEIPFYSGAKYEWKNPAGQVVSNTRTYQVANWNSSYDGTYVATIRWDNCVVRYVNVTVSSILCDEPIDTKADLSVTKTDNKDTYRLNDVCIYTIIVKNNSTTATIPNAKVTDAVPAGIETDKMTYTAVASSGSSTAVTGEQTGAIDDLVILKPGGTVTYTVKVLVSSPFSGDLKNTVNVTMPDGYTDPDPTNNEATDINKPIVIAYNDINQTPQGIAVKGDVLTNDYGVYSVSAKYYDASGNAQDLPVGTATDVYGKDKSGAWKPAGSMKLNADGTYTFTPNSTFIGDVPFDYTGQNTPNYTDDATLSIKVIPNPDAINNNPPIAQNDTYTIEQNQTATVPVLANDSDPDGDNLTVTNVTAKGSGTSTVTLTDTPQDVYVENPSSPGSYIKAGTAKLVNNEIVFTPEADFTGDVPFDYTISDGHGGEDTAVATVTVLPSNNINNVYANDDANTGNKGETISVTNPKDGILGNDIIEGTQGTLTVNGTTISVNNTSVILPGGEGTLTFNPDGTYTFTPNPDFVGTVDIPYTVCNTDGQCDKATLHLTTLDEPIKAKDDAVQTPQGKPVTANVLTNDKGSDIKVTKINGEDVPATGSKTITVTEGSLTIFPDGTYTFTPNADFTGKVPTITYTIKDKYGKEDTAELDITVVPDIKDEENDAPVAINDIRVTKQGEAVNLNVLDNDHDPDKDGITVTEIKLDTNGNGSLETVAFPSGGSVEKDVYDGSRKTGTITIHSNGTTTFTPEANFVGQVPDIEYTIQDDNAAHATATAKIKITVMPDSKNSVFANDDYGVARNAAETIEVEPLKNDFDPEGDNMELVSVQVCTASNTLETLSFTSSWSKDVYDGNTKIGTLSFASNTKKLTFKGEDDFKGTIALPYTIKDSKGATSSATIYLTQLAEGSTPLPIELVSFDARLQGNNVELTWVSATEINNDFYSIYKSNDGETWEFWKDVQGAGNSSVELSYAEMDYEPYQGENYYKLSQTDFDGTTEELGVRQVELTAVNTELLAYPNPTSGELNVVGLTSNKDFVALINTLGQTVSCEMQYNAFKHTITIDMSGLTNGVYILKTTKGNIQVIKR